MSELVRLEVRTRHLPDIAWGYDPAAPSEPSAGGGLGAWFLRWLRPSITIRHPLGQVVKAPWGEPGASTWPLLLLLPGGLLLLVVLLVWYRVRRRRRS